MKYPARPVFYRYTGTPATRAGRIQQLEIRGPRLKDGYVVEYSSQANGRPRSNFTRGTK